MTAYFDFDPEERLRHAWTPIIDVCERGGEIVVRVELPGVRKPDIRLRWRDGVLRISGVKERPPAEKENRRYLCVERQYGPFRRDIAISAAIDLKDCAAEFRDGLLEIRLPKLAARGDSDIPIQ